MTPIPRHHWKIKICNSSSNLSPLETTHWTTLIVPNLRFLVEKEIKSKIDFFRNSGGNPFGKGQQAVELRRLKKFSRRLNRYRLLRRFGLISDEIVVGPTELPISFNNRVFDGDFLMNACLVCGRISTPEQTVFEHFDDTEGMQDYGRYRNCACGDTIAYRIEGQRRP